MGINPYLPYDRSCKAVDSELYGIVFDPYDIDKVIYDHRLNMMTIRCSRDVFPVAMTSRAN